MSSIHHHGPCHPFMSSSHQFTMPSSHLIIHSPCHQFTLTMSSIHHVIQLGSWSMPSIYHVIHSPSQPVTMSFRSYLIISPPAGARWQDLKSLTRKSSSSCWRPPWRGAPSPLGRSSSPFFACATFPSCSHPPTLPHSTANNIFPRAGAAKTYLYWRPLNYSNLGSSHGRNYSILWSRRVWFYSNIEPSNAQNNSISVVYRFLLILQILCKFMRSWEKIFIF